MHSLSMNTGKLGKPYKVCEKPSFPFPGEMTVSACWGVPQSPNVPPAQLRDFCEIAGRTLPGFRLFLTVGGAIIVGFLAEDAIHIRFCGEELLHVLPPFAEFCIRFILLF